MIPKESTEKDPDLFKGTPDERPLTKTEEDELVMEAAKALAEKVEEAEEESTEGIARAKRHRWTKAQEDQLKGFSDAAKKLPPNKIVKSIKKLFPGISDDAIKSKIYDLRRVERKEQTEKGEKKSVSYYSAEEVPEDVVKEFKQEKFQQKTQEENSTILTKVTLPGSSMFEESLVDIKITGVFKIEIIHLHKK